MRSSFPSSCTAPHRLALAAAALPAVLAAQSPKHLTSFKELFGWNIGDDYHMATYTQLEAHWKKLAAESDRLKLVDIGPTAEGRPQYMAIISSPKNLANLEHYRDIAARLAHARNLTDEQARALAREGKAIVWEDGGLHATETVGSQQLMETVWQMVTRTDAETLRFLEDDILLAVQANPDGQEMVAKWYMREPDSTKRSLLGLPRLYNKYIGHDDNRDFFISNMPETTNMNRVMFLEWFPEIVYNHHQPGFNVTGAVIFMPPFRDPFNYHFDPLIPVEIEEVGAAMHARLIEHGLPGSGMRSFSNYSTWWNGGLRTIGYFHNTIGLLTEIIGDPTPTAIPLIPDRQLPTGDLPFPAPPQPWHYRQSIDYDVENNRAVLDYASRNRERLLYDMYVKGKRAIDAGSHDSWTITPQRIEALKEANGGATLAGTAPTAGIRGNAVPATLYQSVLHDPKYRDPRGYIIPTNQADFLTATKFVNALLKTGLDVDRATRDFTVNGKTYPVGSYVVKSDQPFRAHVLDMFEPQDHPNDFRYPGGPPIPPYDITGWTLAMQMGVQYDRVYDAFEGPFARIDGLVHAPAGAVVGAANPAGYLVSHRTNDQFILANRLLSAGARVFWSKAPLIADGEELGAGALWIPAAPPVHAIVAQAAKELGLTIHGVAAAPAAGTLELHPVRVGVVDIYGGLMPAGWTRWLLEQYGFSYQLVFPQRLDAGNLNASYDVLVFPDGAYRKAPPSASGGMRVQSGADTPGGGPGIDVASIPTEYRGMLGKVTVEKTVPRLGDFVRNGGTVLTIGSSTALGEPLGAGVTNHLAEIDKGAERPLPPEKFYIPGSLLRVEIDNANPIAFGMPDHADVVFDNSPVFRLAPDAAQRHTAAVAWYGSRRVLESGWAWGQQYLDGGAAVVESSIGKGRVVMYGPEVLFRGQPHGTFKLFFNGVAMEGAR